MVDALLGAVAGIGPSTLLLIIGAFLVGGAAQTTVGFGAGYVAVPALALVAPELLPGTMLTAALPMTLVMVLLEHANLDRRVGLRLVVARVPGIAVGSGIVIFADTRMLTLVIGTVLLFAVGVAAFGWRVAVTPGREWFAGMLSGVTGASTALGGPPLALLYRDRDPAVIRPTLSVVWAAGIAMTLTSLAVMGQYTALHAVLGLTLSIVVLIGVVIGRRLIAHIPATTIRTTVLWWAGIGGVAAMLRAVA